MGKDGRDFSILLIQLSGRIARRLLSFREVCSIVYLQRAGNDDDDDDDGRSLEGEVWQNPLAYI